MSDLSKPRLYYELFCVQANLIHEKIVIFVCSTTGDGEEPDNMKVRGKYVNVMT